MNDCAEGPACSCVPVIVHLLRRTIPALSNTAVPPRRHLNIAASLPRRPCGMTQRQAGRTPHALCASWLTCTSPSYFPQGVTSNAVHRARARAYALDGLSGQQLAVALREGLRSPREGMHDDPPLHKISHARRHRHPPPPAGPPSIDRARRAHFEIGRDELPRNGNHRAAMAIPMAASGSAHMSRPHIAATLPTEPHALGSSKIVDGQLQEFRWDFNLKFAEDRHAIHIACQIACLSERNFQADSDQR